VSLGEARPSFGEMISNRGKNEGWLAKNCYETDSSSTEMAEGKREKVVALLRGRRKVRHEGGPTKKKGEKESRRKGPEGRGDFTRVLGRETIEFINREKEKREFFWGEKGKVRTGAIVRR